MACPMAAMTKAEPYTQRCPFKSGNRSLSMRYSETAKAMAIWNSLECVMRKAGFGDCQIGISCFVRDSESQNIRTFITQSFRMKKRDVNVLPHVEEGHKNQKEAKVD